MAFTPLERKSDNMRSAILGAVVGIVLAVFGTLFYVNSVQSIANMAVRISAIETFLNQQIELSKNQRQLTPVPSEKINDSSIKEKKI
jgi:hypothetical protein